MTTVNQGVRKLDAMQLVTGQPVYTEDIAPENCLVVKLLRSPHANAVVREIDTERAMRVPGMEAVFTWKDVPQNARRYTQAGQTAPEPSPARPARDRPPCPLCGRRCRHSCRAGRGVRR